MLSLDEHNKHLDPVSQQPANSAKRYKQWGLISREEGGFLEDSYSPSVEERCLDNLCSVSLKDLFACYKVIVSLVNPWTLLPS